MLLKLLQRQHQQMELIPENNRQIRLLLQHFVTDYCEFKTQFSLSALCAPPRALMFDGVTHIAPTFSATVKQPATKPSTIPSAHSVKRAAPVPVNQAVATPLSQEHSQRRSDNWGKPLPAKPTNLPTLTEGIWHVQQRRRQSSRKLLTGASSAVVLKHNQIDPSPDGRVRFTCTLKTTNISTSTAYETR